MLLALREDDVHPWTASTAAAASEAACPAAAQTAPPPVQALAAAPPAPLVDAGDGVACQLLL